jgi:hypothetical protein
MKTRRADEWSVTLAWFRTTWGVLKLLMPRFHSYQSNLGLGVGRLDVKMA